MSASTGCTVTEPVSHEEASRRDRESGPGRGRAIALLGVFAIFLVGLLRGFASPLRLANEAGDDSIGHFVLAREALSMPVYLLDEWGRPGLTIPFALVSWAGDGTAIVLSALISALSGWLAWRLAAQWRIRFAPMAPLFLLLQPLFWIFTTSVMTEPMLGLQLVGGLWLLSVNRIGWAALCLSLTPLTRHEAIVLFPLWALILGRHRRLDALAILFSTLLAYNLFAWAVLDRWPLSIYFDSKPTDFYGHGEWSYFLSHSPEVFNACLIPLMLVGLAACLRHTGGGGMALAILLWFAVQSYLYWKGMFASGGYPRFLLPLSPLMAVAACAGVDTVLGAAMLRGRAMAGWLAWAGVAALLMGSAAYWKSARDALGVDPQFERIRQEALWFKAHSDDHQRVVTSHVAFYYFLPDQPLWRWWAAYRLDEMAGGDHVLWDANYGPRMLGPLDQFQKDAKYRPVRTVQNPDGSIGLAWFVLEEPPAPTAD